MPYRGVGLNYARQKRLDKVAAEMRAYNLNHGSGCKSTARAIENRMRSQGRR